MMNGKPKLAYPARLNANMHQGRTTSFDRLGQGMIEFRNGVAADPCRRASESASSGLSSSPLDFEADDPNAEGSDGEVLMG
jgi:hypothetical protein